MTSPKPYDFLSELKATLSRLTSRDDPDGADHVTDDIPENQRPDVDHQDTARAPSGDECRRSVLYGELNSVLERRGQQQTRTDQPDLVDLETRLKPGKSIVYLGSGQRKDTTVPPKPRPPDNCPHDDVTLTSAPADAGQPTDVINSEEESSSTGDVISTSSAVISVTRQCPSSSRGNLDSACVMSTDESAGSSSDCGILTLQPDCPPAAGAEQRHNASDHPHGRIPRDQRTCRSCSLKTTGTPQPNSSYDDSQSPLLPRYDTFPFVRWCRRLPGRYIIPNSASTTAVATATDEALAATYRHHDDVITNLMITHSGEPISVGIEGKENVIDRPLSVPVTVPEPTSFHQDGSQIRRQLLASSLGYSTSASPQRPQHHDSAQQKTAKREYDRRCRRARRRRRRRRSGGQQTGVVVSTTSDSEMTPEPAGGRNWRLSPSPVFHLLHHHHQASYCVNSNKEAQRLNATSPNSLVIESSAETDSPSICQSSLYDGDDNQFEQSLLTYVKKEELSTMKRDTRSLYHYPLDTSRTPVQSQSSLLDQLACCLACNYSGPVNCRNLPRHQSSTSYERTCMVMPVTAQGVGLVKAVVEQTSDFHVDTNGLRGSLKVLVDGPSHSVKCYAEKERNGRYRIYYCPTEVGLFTVTLTWNDDHLDGSPYHVPVTNPKKVLISDGWRKLNSSQNQLEMTVNEEKTLQFDVKRAGPGELSVYCIGPQSLAPCTLTDHQNGRVTLMLCPFETGKHSLHVKFGGVHVPGSPFPVDVRCAATSDASRIHVSGPGISHGVLGTFSSYICIDTSEAGFGQLNVTVRGPKGAFRVEMKRCHPKDRTVECSYNPTECGLYTIRVKWSGDDVPGSPFHVRICQTKTDLELYESEETTNQT